MVDMSEMTKGIPCNIYCLQWDLYKNENSAASARVLHELGGKRDHERVIWTCLWFGRAINSVRKLHPKGPNRSKYKTMTRIAYYVLKMQVRRGEYKVLAVQYLTSPFHVNIYAQPYKIKEKNNEIYIFYVRQSDVYIAISLKCYIHYHKITKSNIM